MDKLKHIDPSRAVCFSGHRPDRLPGFGDPNTVEAKHLIIALQKQIENAIRRGKDTFLHGAMAGFDILAAEQIIKLKENRQPCISLPRTLNA